MSVQSASDAPKVAPSQRSAIPIRNLWFLLMYVPELAEFVEPLNREIDGAADIVDVLGRLLAVAMDRRLRRSLSRAYQPRSAVLTRVRGRIDVLQTESRRYRDRGRLVCRFDELTVDNPRNRYARAALERTAREVEDVGLAHRCRTLARDLLRLGVSHEYPTDQALRREQILRHDGDDRLMVSVSRLALRRVLPSEHAGTHRVMDLKHDEDMLPRIFERAVAGFYSREVDGRDGWTVTRQKQLRWPIAETGHPHMPEMRADVMLENPLLPRRIVIETKFCSILTARPYGGRGFSNPHICQLYSYLQSQSGKGEVLADTAEGVLLYPAVGCSIDETVTIQGHKIRFATVDLALPPQEIRNRLLELVRDLNRAP